MHIDMEYGMPSTFWDKIGTGVGPNYISAILLTLINLINYLDRYSLEPILDDLKNEFHIDEESKIRTLRSIQHVALAIIPPLYGILADRTSRKLIMILSLSISSTFVIISSYSNSYWMYLVFEFLIGSGQAGFTTIAPTVIADLFAAPISENTSTLSMWLSVFFIQMPLGGGLSYLIGDYVKQNRGWRWAKRYTVFVSWPLIIVLLFVLKDPQRGGSEVSAENSQMYKEWSFRRVISDIKHIFSVPSYRLSIIATTFLYFTTIGISQYSSVLPKYASRYREIELGIDVTGEPQEPFTMYVGAVLVGGGCIGCIAGTIFSVVIRPRCPWIDPIIIGVSILMTSITWIPTLLIAKLSINAYLTLLFFCMLFISTNLAVRHDIMLYIIPPSLRSTSFGLSMLITHTFGDSISPIIVASIVHWVQTDNKYSSKYHSLQKGLSITVVTSFLSGLIFVCISRFVVKDKEKAALCHSNKRQNDTEIEKSFDQHNEVPETSESSQKQNIIDHEIPTDTTIFFKSKLMSKKDKSNLRLPNKNRKQYKKSKKQIKRENTRMAIENLKNLSILM